MKEQPRPTDIPSPAELSQMLGDQSEQAAIDQEWQALGNQADALHTKLNGTKQGAETNSTDIPAQPDTTVKGHDAEKEADSKKELESIFGKVANFASSDERKFAAGPDIRKATGLDRIKILELGFKNYTELESKALDWKSTKDAEAKAAEFHAANNAKADAWNAERDAHRQAKQAGSERVEKLSYKMKLQNGGELGLKRRPGIAEKIQEDAVAQAEAEGLAVDHLKPSEGYQVPTNAAAEARQSEYAAMLKAFDREILSAQANTTPDDVQPVGRHRAPDAAAGANVAENWGEVTLTNVSDETVAVHAKGRFARARASLRNLYEKAGVKVSNGMNKAMEYLTDEQKGRRRGIVAGVAGVGLVALAYGASRGFSFGEAAHPKGGGTNPDILNALSGKGDKSGTAANSEIVNALGGGPKAQQAQQAQEAIHAVKLEHGQTIYGQERVLHPRATEAQLHAYTQRALDMNHINWEQARHLAEGEEVKLA